MHAPLLPGLGRANIEEHHSDTVRLWLICSFSEHVHDPLCHLLPDSGNEKNRPWPVF
jgi:hypothetical protein